MHAVPGAAACLVPITHTLVLNLVEFYALGALPRDVQNQVHAHLKNCGGCRAKAALALQLAQLLLLIPPDVEPEPHVRTRLLAAAKADRKINPTHKPVTAH